MKVQLSFLCLLALGAHATSVTPVQKVLDLLNGMMEKGKKEKHEEEVMWAQTRQFCGDTEVEKKHIITEELETIDNLEALINKDTATADHLRKLISLLSEDEDKWSGDINAAEKVRQIENADYMATHADYEESIDALKRAIQTLKKPSGDKKQASGFIQVSALQGMNLIPEKAKKTIGLFLQQSDSDESIEEAAPEANAYEFQSHGVIDMLEKLMDKFIDEKTNLEKEEANSKNAYELLLQELHAEIKQAVKDRHLKEENKGETLQRKASEEGDLHDESDTELSDEKFLEKFHASCEMKESDFHARQDLRAEEIESIEKAIGIIEEGVVGNSEKHLPQLLQTGASFSQLRSSADANARSGLNAVMQQRVAMFLQGRSKKLDSRLLEAAAQKISADPFAKVKKMLKDLTVRLMEEANEEAEHKGWCDTELSTNEQTRKEKTDSVEKLHSKIDELSASLTKLGESIVSITHEISELDKAVAKATKIRTEEKSKNKETVQDAQDAQTALAQALTVLREFYAKAAEATALVQEPYKGMGAENGGVVGMLEVIESDFARLESETKAAEASAQKEYDQFMEDSKIDKAKKSTDVEHKSAKKTDQEGALTETKEDLEGTQKELDSALAYFDKLKPSCVDQGESYEERVARRKEEIDSMQEALKILNGEELA